MASYALQDVLGYVYLGGLVESVKTGIPNVLPPEFMKVNRQVMGDSIRYTRVTGTRRLAKRVEYGAPAYKDSLSSVGEFDVKMLHSFSFIQLPKLAYDRLRSYSSYENDQGKQELLRQTEQFVAKYNNLRIAAVTSVVANGKIWFDSSGNLLPTSSGAAVTIDYGMSANHLNQLNGIIAASWATASTDIALHITNLQSQALQDTGYKLTKAFYGKNIPSYLATNNFFNDWLIRNPAAQTAWLSSRKVPSGFMELEWIPVHSAFFEDSSGTNQTFFGADQVTFTPDVDQTWYEVGEGSYGVPTSFNPTSNLQAAMGSLENVYGMFSYALPEHNPLTANLFHGDTFLPIIKNPDVMYIADVTP